MNFNAALLKIGLTPIEATVFITLVQNGALTGYEVAKLAGLSRSNVYAALYNLQEKGKCYLVEGDTNKYIALSKEELLHDVQVDYEAVCTAIDTYFPKSVMLSEPYITIKGYDNILKKIKGTILSCESHLYILSTADIIGLVKEEIEKISTSKRVTIITNKHLIIENVLIHTKAKSPSGFHMIMDTACVLTGDLGDSCQCLYTCNDSLVRLMRESFITELDMIKITEQ